MINNLAYIIKRISLRFIDWINDLACKKLVVASEGVRFFIGADVQNIPGIKERITVGRNSRIRGELLIFPYGGNINIGENCFLGKNSRIWSGDNVIIGNNVLISHNVNVIDTNSHELNHSLRAEGFINLIEHGQPKEKGVIETAPIMINDNVWVSFGVSILKGVTIGKGAIVAAGSVVTRDVKPFVLVGGNPAKVLKKLN